MLLLLVLLLLLLLLKHVALIASGVVFPATSSVVVYTFVIDIVPDVIYTASEVSPLLQMLLAFS